MICNKSAKMGLSQLVQPHFEKIQFSEISVSIPFTV